MNIIRAIVNLAHHAFGNQRCPSHTENEILITNHCRFIYFEEVPNFAEEDDEEFDQDSYDEQVYDQPSNEFETDAEMMDKE